MDASIREYRPTDQTEVLDLSLRAWEPNFASMEDVLGREILPAYTGTTGVHINPSVSETSSQIARSKFGSARTLTATSLGSPQPRL